MTKFLKLLVAGLAAVGLAAGSTSVLAQKTEAPKKTEAAKPAAAAPATAPKAEPMDINTASEKELASLKGIGEARSKAIVKGRPYKGKDELVQKKIVPQNVYDDIKEQIIAKQDTMKAPAKKKA
jgi:DNA uptake protein ComE-like DNA-binding protein